MLVLTGILKVFALVLFTLAAFWCRRCFFIYLYRQTHGIRKSTFVVVYASFVLGIAPVLIPFYQEFSSFEIPDRLIPGMKIAAVVGFLLFCCLYGMQAFTAKK